MQRDLPRAKEIGLICALDHVYTLEYTTLIIDTQTERAKETNKQINAYIPRLLQREVAHLQHCIKICIFFSPY